MSYKKKYCLSDRSKRRRVQEEVEIPMVLNNVEKNSTSHLVFEPSFLKSNNTLVTMNDASTSSTAIDSALTNTVVTNENEYFKELNQSLSSSLSSNEDNTDNEDLTYFNDDVDQLSLFSSLIAQWAVSFNISQNALNALLKLLKHHKCFETLPIDSRTILSTNKLCTSNFRVVEPGKYHHFGILNGIKQNIPDCFDDKMIKIVVGIDGLPIFKSSPEQFWPILAYIRPYNNQVFPIGIYCGQVKPIDSNDFLKEFVDEAKILSESSVYINNKKYFFSIDVFCCDAPAKSFILKTKGHSGFFSCSRCEHEGQYLSNRICFPYTLPSNCPPKRTHDNYILQTQEEHHIGNISILATLPNFNITTGFSLDYMHLVCLGTVRKLILLWMKGPNEVRYPSWKIKEISSYIQIIKNKMPCEFVRKPRNLDEVNRWKATEFRMFLLYYGIIVTKPTLKHQHWNHFFNLSISMIILLSPDHSKYLNVARQLLDSFVKDFEIIYGRYLISHNIHGLTHLSDDYDKFGPLDNCSAFPFENYMGCLKRMLRKPHKPLEQVIKRYREICLLKSSIKTKNCAPNFSGLHTHGPTLSSSIKGKQFTTLILKNMTIKTHLERDSYFLTQEKKIVKIFNIIQKKNSEEVLLICKIFDNKNELFIKPIKSSELDIYVVKNLSNNFHTLNIKDIKKKMILLPSNNNDFIVLPIIHSSFNI